MPEDLTTLLALTFESTTKEALVNARVGQGLFRTQVLRVWGHCCAVTRSTTLDAIRASHIKPWRDCTNEERLDPNNGLPLVASLDALFDKGLISFDASGTLIASPTMNVVERELFGLSGKSLANRASTQTEGYLVYHREHVFRK